MPGKPKPTALKVFEGNRGRRPLPAGEPKPRPIIPKCPKWLDKNARKIFRKESKKFYRVGLLTEIDGDQFGVMCQTIAYLKKVIAELEECELILKSDEAKPEEKISATTSVKPLHTEFRLLANLFRAYAPEFGGTPRGRASLSVGVDKNEDGEDLLSK